MSDFWDWFVFRLTGKFPRSVERRVYDALEADRQEMQRAFEEQQERAACQLALSEANAQALMRQLEEATSRLSAATARADNHAEAVTRLTALVDRSQTAIERQMDTATAYFRSKATEVENRLATAEAASREARACAHVFRDIVSDMQALMQETRASIPAAAEQALRALVSEIEQEEGVLALALANVNSFTSTVSKTLERDQ